MNITLVATGTPAPTVTVYRVPREVIKATLGHLQRYGEAGLEAVGYWVGSCHEATADISRLWIPQFEATPVSYDVESHEMLRLKAELDGSGCVLLAQVHSHPASAFHSRRDDLNAASPWPGFISIVVPNAGRISGLFFDGAEVFEHLGNARWTRLGVEKKRSRFVIV